MDPTEQLYNEFNMGKSTVMGHSSTYASDSVITAMGKGLSKAVGQLFDGLMFKGGDSKTIGGEFLYEMVPGGEKETFEITWCHRMKDTTDHSDIKELQQLLRL